MSRLRHPKAGRAPLQSLDLEMQLGLGSGMGLWHLQGPHMKQARPTVPMPTAWAVCTHGGRTMSPRPRSPRSLGEQGARVLEHIRNWMAQTGQIRRWVFLWGWLRQLPAEAPSELLPVPKERDWPLALRCQGAPCRRETSSSQTVPWPCS